MAQSSRQMKMVGFLQAQNCSIAPGSWRHPAAATDFTGPEYFQQLGRVMEEGKFHLIFFDDRLALPDIFSNDFRDAVANGVRVVKMDPATIITMIGAVTSRLGLGITYSTTYYEPFHVARLFGTLDLMTKGRAAWNVVTSLNNSEAANFGRVEHLAHDLRYERADEFMEVALGLWDSWEDGALLVDLGLISAGLLLQSLVVAFMGVETKGLPLESVNPEFEPAAVLREEVKTPV